MKKHAFRTDPNIPLGAKYVDKICVSKVANHCERKGGTRRYRGKTVQNTR